MTKVSRVRWKFLYSSASQDAAGVVHHYTTRSKPGLVKYRLVHHDLSLPDVVWYQRGAGNTKQRFDSLEAALAN